MQLPCAASNATVLGVAFAAIVFAAAQSVPEQHPPDALELLRNVEATYAAMGTYSGKSTHVMDMSGPSMQNKMEIRSEEHTSELQSRRDLVCRLLLEKKK